MSGVAPRSTSGQQAIWRSASVCVILATRASKQAASCKMQAATRKQPHLPAIHLDYLAPASPHHASVSIYALSFLCVQGIYHVPFYVHGPSSLNTLPVSLFCTVAGLTLARKSLNRGCNALILIDSCCWR